MENCQKYCWTFSVCKRQTVQEKLQLVHQARSLKKWVPQLQSGNDLFFQNSFGPPKFLLVLHSMVVSSKDVGTKLPSTTTTTPPVAAPFQVQAQAPLHRWWQRFILVSWERGGLGGLNRNSTEAAQT